MTCADCGAEVVLHGARWAVRSGNDKRPSWHYTCRTTYRHGKLLSADYHYIEGEVQMHWPSKDTEP